MGTRAERLGAGALATRVARDVAAEIEALPVRNTLSVRAVRRRHSRALAGEEVATVLEVARELRGRYGQHWVAYELIAAHPAAFRSLGPAEVEEFGQGMDSWSRVDSFARTLSGPAWRDGLVGDALIHHWTGSEDRWWRRAALVSTVALNVRSHGGTGDAGRTLEVCRLLAGDPDDMVVKALSWALRELVVHDPGAVERFLSEHGEILAARVKREVGNKLRTGLKNPRA
jgi:3-methyladenine DNA glycosylase AlkD